MMKGARGAFPPADACDYARYISQLDFYWITDHAEAYTPQHWKDSVAAIRQCNVVSGDAQNPDLVAFVGWEWTQMGVTAKDHYGPPQCVSSAIPSRIRSRPGRSRRQVVLSLRSEKISAACPQPSKKLTTPNRSYYEAFQHFAEEMGSIPLCEEGVSTRELPPDCLENSSRPQRLIYKNLKSGALIPSLPRMAVPGVFIHHLVRAGIIS